MKTTHEFITEAGGYERRSKFELTWPEPPSVDQIGQAGEVLAGYHRNDLWALGLVLPTEPAKGGTPNQTL